MPSALTYPGVYIEETESPVRTIVGVPTSVTAFVGLSPRGKLNTPVRIGGVMVLLLWFYVSSLAILVGAEMNAEIEHASPHGKDPGEKVPGQRRVIGVRAAREWAARHRRGSAATQA